MFKNYIVKFSAKSVSAFERYMFRKFFDVKQNIFLFNFIFL